MSHLSNIMRQVKKIELGAGLQNILDEAYNILGNPIVLYSAEYNLLAHNDVLTDDPFWNELISSGTFSIETLKFFENEGFIEELANSPKSALLKSDKVKYDRITGKLFNKEQSYTLNLGIVACHKPFEEHDQIVFEAICKIISTEINNNELYQEYEQVYKINIIKKLIEGNYDKNLDLAKVESIYDLLKSNLYLAVVDISLCSTESTIIGYFKDLFKQVSPDFKYALYGNYIIIIISTNDDALIVNKELCGLIKIFEPNNMYAGISSRFENLFELKKYYEEALEAMQYAFEVGSNQRVFPCETSSIKKMKQIQALENGLGVQYFLNEAYKIFGNPVLFHDMELNLLAYTENVEILDPIWQELITYGTGSDETIEMFRTEGWIDIMDNTKGGALLVSDKCRYDRISWRIYTSDNIRIACTSIVNTVKPFSDDELVLFGAFSQKFCKEISNIEFYNNYGQLYSGTIINSLISGEIDDYTFYSKDIGNLYDKLMDNLYLVVIDMTLCKPEQVNLTYFRSRLNWLNTVNRYTIYEDNIIIIISLSSALLNENTELNKISSVFEENNIYAGISSCFDDLYDVQKHYKEAVTALKHGIENRELNDKKRVFQYKG